jgi:Coatomer (COPI) alpha subunit C-terminus
LQELIRKTTEYISAMRLEIERKRLQAANGDNARIAELACYMTVCAMDIGHKFLAYKNAMNINYKLGNNITAANYARLILEMEPTGVRLSFLKVIGFRLETRDPTTDEEVLSSILG